MTGHTNKAKEQGAMVTCQRLAVVREERVAPLGTYIDADRSVFSAATLCSGLLADEAQEVLLVLIFDVRLRLIAYQEVARGLLSEVPALPRNVVTPALLVNGHSIILCHNHPSGDPSPSEPDADVTARTAAACALLGVNFLDHLVVGSEGRVYSFAKEGVIHLDDE